MPLYLNQLKDGQSVLMHAARRTAAQSQTLAFSAAMSFSATAEGSPISSSFAIRTGVTVTPTVVDLRSGSCKRMLAPDLLVSFQATGYSM